MPNVSKDMQSGEVYIQHIAETVAYCYAVDDKTKASFPLEMDAQELLKLGLTDHSRFHLRITTEITPLPPKEITPERMEEIDKMVESIGLKDDDLQNDY